MDVLELPSTFQLVKNTTFLDQITSEVSPLRPHQKECIQLMRGSSSKLALVSIPTGGGKSALITLAPFAYGAKRALILTPSNVIRNQLSDEWNIVRRKKTGVVSNPSKTFNLFPSAKAVVDRVKSLCLVDSQIHALTDFSAYELVVTNVQKFNYLSTLKIDKFSSFDLIIFDEAHHYPADSWLAIVRFFHDLNARIVFFTGTPYRGCRPTLLTHLTLAKLPSPDLLFEVSRPTLITNGYIRPFLFVEIGNSVIIVDEQNQCFDELLIQHLKKLLRLRKRDKAFYLCQSTQDCDNVQDLFNQDGDKEMYAIAHHQNSDGLDSFHNDQNCRVIVVCQKLIEGYDNNEISIVVLGRPVRSPIVFNQCIGRAGRRTGPTDKRSALILSHKSYCQREIVTSYLDDFEPKTFQDLMESSWQDDSDPILAEIEKHAEKSQIDLQESTNLVQEFQKLKLEDSIRNFIPKRAPKDEKPDDPKTD